MLLCKKVKCVDCGYLGIVPLPFEYREDPLYDFSWDKIDEIPPHWREEPKYISGEKSLKLLGCYMRQFHQLECVTMDLYETIPDKAVKALSTPRKCKFFYKYHPGFSSVEHKELQRDYLNRRTLFLASIISAIIGAAFATIVNIIWNVVT